MYIDSSSYILDYWCHGGASNSLLPNSFSLLKTFTSKSQIRLLPSIYMNESNTEHSQETITTNHQLRLMTAEYLTKHSTLTLNALAQRCGVPATTMRRLMQEEQRSELAPHSVLALVSYLLKEKKISKILKTIQGPVADLLNKCFDQFIFDEESSDHEVSPDLNTIFRDKISYLIYKLAANKCGTTIEEVKNTLGLVGLRKLNDLIEKNWVEASGNRLHAKQKDFSVDLALAHELSHTLVDMYKPSDVKQGMNLFYSLSEGMTEEGIHRIKEIEKDAVKKIYDLMNTESLQGTIPYFALVISDVIGPTPNEENQCGVLQ